MGGVSGQKPARLVCQCALRWCFAVAVVIGDVEIPTDQSGQVWVHFAKDDLRRYVIAELEKDANGTWVRRWRNSVPKSYDFKCFSAEDFCVMFYF